MRKFIQNIFLVALLIAYCNSSFSGTIDPNTSDDKHIKYGEKFDYVHSLCGLYKDDSLFCGSCVSIGPRWIITAAHVVENSKHVFVTHKDKHVLIIETIIHSNFDTNKFGNSDIAMCYLAEDLNLDFYPEPYENNDENNQICSIAGYGFTGTFVTGIKNHDGKKRAGSNYIDRTYKDLLICSASNNKKTELEFLICSGDSGGGLFIGNKLAGINSCVIAGDDRKPDSSYGDESGHTRVSIFVDWIKENIKKKNEIMSRPCYFTLDKLF